MQPLRLAPEVAERDRIELLGTASHPTCGPEELYKCSPAAAFCVDDPTSRPMGIASKLGLGDFLQVS
jgi:hypothetical protein